MTSSALLTLYRSLTRHRLHAILSIGGLALGIAVFLVLYLYVQFERDYDRHLPGSEDIYVVTQTYYLPGIPETPSLDTMGGLIDQLKADFPNLEGARSKRTGAAVIDGASSTSEDMQLVDATFFDLFPYPVVAGDAEAALVDPDSVVITEGLARKYFGVVDAVGKTLTMTVWGETRPFRVGAVLEQPPANRTFDEEMFVRFVRERYPNEYFDNWGSQSLNTFVRMPNREAAGAFTTELPAFIDRHTDDAPAGSRFSDISSLQLEPLHNIHLMEDSEKTVVVTLGLVGLLTLAIAIVNYVNLATARAGLRAREVAVRKVLGGTRRSLIVQFVTEAIAAVTLAALVGLALTELALPFVNSLGGTDLAIAYWGSESVLPPLAVMVVIVGLLAGLYPALFLSGFQPSAVLASARAPGGGRSGQRLRRALVVAQFAIAIAFMIGTIVLVAQTEHLRAADLGFQREGIITARSFIDLPVDGAQAREMLNTFRGLDGVTGVTVSNDTPGHSYTTSSTNISRVGDDMPEPSLTWVLTRSKLLSDLWCAASRGTRFRLRIRAG